MESQPQNPEFRINSENFQPCIMVIYRESNVNISTCIMMARSPAIITTDWKTSVHTTAFIPPCVNNKTMNTIQYNTIQYNRNILFCN